MQLSTVFVLLCLAVASYSYPQPEAVEALAVPDDLAVYEPFEQPELERAPRNKRGLLLLKKKLLLGALGLKAAKIGGAAVGAAGVIALKSKPHHHYSGGSHASHSYGYSSHGPEWNVQVHSWH